MDYVLNLFEGRIGRKYYNISFIFLTILLTIITPLLSGKILLTIIICTVSFVMLSLQIRRLHDLNQPGHTIFLFIVPVINMFLLVWLFIAPSRNKDNKFGPKANQQRNFLKTILNLPIVNTPLQKNK